MKKTYTAVCIAAGFGGVVLLGTAGQSSSDPEVSAPPLEPAEIVPASVIAAATPEAVPPVLEGVGGTFCHYENLRLGVSDDITRSQKDVNGKFYIETADDFVLVDPDDPDGLNPCVLDQVVFAVTSTPFGPDTWAGVKITIYQDRGNVCAGQPLAPPCLRNPDKGPAGFPLPTPDSDIREHQPCCTSPNKEAIVCELKVSMDKVSLSPLPFLDSFEVTVSGLKQFGCVLQKNKKYWIAPAPVTIIPIEQTFLFTSPNSADHEAQTINPLFGPPAWSTISTQLGHIHRDLYLAIWANKVLPPPPCHYENLVLGLPGPPSQKNVSDPPFYFEAADDFVLTDPDDPDGSNQCRLDQVTFAVQHKNPMSSPNDWNGVKITIYQDRGVVCAGQAQLSQCSLFADKGPAGFPVATTGDRDHQPCCFMPSKEAIVCELKVPMSKVTWVPLPAPGGYEITVSGLDQFACDLEKNKKYWCAPAPVMPLVDPAGGNLGTTLLYMSPINIDHEAQVIIAPLVPWTPLTLVPDLKLVQRDLYLAIWASKVTSCPWDCGGDNDGDVGIVDFLALLGQWGQVGTSCDFDGAGVGIVDFLKLLANWGPCP